MKALSLDLRQRIADALEAGQPQASIAERFAVSVSSVERIARKWRAGHSLVPGTSSGMKPLVGAPQRAAFEALAASRTDWTLRTLADAWREQQGQGGAALSLATVSRVLRRCGFTHKKSAASRGSGTKPGAKRSASA